MILSSHITPLRSVSNCQRYNTQGLSLTGHDSSQWKVEGPATILTFLCIELDTIKMKLRLPQSKLNEILQN